jgi:hypothetical protein
VTENQGRAVIAFALLALYWFTRPRPLIASVSTSSTFNLGLTSKIRKFADAIARAEGFYVAGSIPARSNNPGDLKSPTWTYPGELEGQSLGEGIATFRSSNDGWNALYNQLALIVNGESSVYSLDDTIASMGSKWAGAGEGSTWAANVAAYVGAPASSKLYEVLV